MQPSVSADAAGVYIVGSTAGVLPGQTSLGGSNDAFIRKYDFNGDVLWTHQFGTPNSDLAFDVAGDGSNVYVVGGTIKFLNQTSINGFVQRYDASGNLLSSQQMGPGDYDTARAVAVSGGEVYIGGETKGTFPGQVRFSNDAFLVRLEMGSPPPLKFVPTTPCRIVDTRPGQGTTGGFGPPVLQPGVRAFALPAGRCTVPPDARAYSLNVTVVPLEPLAFLTLWPYGHSQPLVSTLNSFHGGVVANAAIVRAGLNGAISVYATNRTDLVIDINGYFIAETVPQGHSFYTVDPCRLVDTRNPAGAFGGPALTAGGTRNFSVPGGSCRIPSWATAYSVNATVVPALALHYLTLWPGGQIQPFVSTLNSFDGTVVANAAIVQAGNAGDVSAFTTNATELILDTNGFFGPSGNPGDLRFYPLFPCRVADTRTDVGAALLRAGDTREFVVQGKCNVPVTAKAYAMNVTVAPSGPLGYLTLWPSGTGRPLVSTLNSFLGRVVANAALAPAGLSGTMSVFVTNDTHVILDINGYFQ